MIDKDIKEAIEDEKYLKLPFITNYQTEAQSIVHNLWKDETIPFGKKWLNSSARIEEEHLVVYIIEDSENNIQIMIENFEKYIPNYLPKQNSKIIVRGFSPSYYESMGIAILAIVDSFHRIFLEVAKLHKKIIEINKSTIDIATQKYFIKLAIENVDKLLDENTYLVDFSYPKNIIEDLNDLHLYHSWIDKDDSFFIDLALDAYRDITYYNKWIEEHHISEKHFIEKRIKIHEMYKKVIKYFDIKSNYSYGKLPQHPQDILHGLVSFYNDYYQKDINDSAIQDIIKIISDYKRMPKISKSKKTMKRELDIRDSIIDIMHLNNWSQEEIFNYIFDGEIKDELLTDDFCSQVFLKLFTEEDIKQIEKEFNSLLQENEDIKSFLLENNKELLFKKLEEAVGLNLKKLLPKI